MGFLINLFNHLDTKTIFKSDAFLHDHDHPSPEPNFLPKMII